MLAYIAHSSPRPEDHTPSSPPTNAMSLAILPSAPMAYSRPHDAPSPPKRPKLSINTDGGAVLFGKKSTSLRLETLSATSPTSVNTFSNGHDEHKTIKVPNSKPARPSLTPITTDVPFTPLQTRLPPSTNDFIDSSDSIDLSSSATSATSLSTVDSYQTEIPYKPSYSVTSILSNGPYPKLRNPRHTFAQSRPMFPSAKKVAFRAPLTEEITTTKYTMAHSDIESSTSTISTIQLSPEEDQESKAETSLAVAIEKEEEVVIERKKDSPTTGDKRESSDEEDDESCPATPVAGKRKCDRQWRWTLGPIGNIFPSNETKNIEIEGEEKHTLHIQSEES